MSITKSLYALAGTFLVAENTFADGCTVFGCDKATGLPNQNADAFAAITKVINQLLTLVTIIAVAYALYAGFQIMTA